MGSQPVAHRSRHGLLAAVLLVLAGCEAPSPTTSHRAGVSLGIDRASAVAAAGHAPVAISDRAHQPAAPASASLPPVAPPAAPAGAGGSSGSSGVGGEVRDEAELPIAGATVLLLGGRTARTGPDGRFRLSGTYDGGPVIVSKPGYATSVVASLDALTTLHLRRADGRSESFVSRRGLVEGTIRWPEIGHVGGAVHYMDSLDSLSRPALLHDGDRFGIEVETVRSGEPMAVLLVLSSTDERLPQLLVGVSRPFAPFGGEGPGEVPVHLADQTLVYAVSEPPAGLTAIASQLEVVQAGVPFVVLEGADSLNGSFLAPAPGALPGTLRITVEARAPGGDAYSRVSMVPESGQATADLLTPPYVSRSGAEISWSAVPEASGYRLAVHAAGAASPLYEAWTTDTRLALPTEVLAHAGTGEVRLEAVQAEGLTARHVASVAPRALRVAPWAQSAVYRVAGRRFSL